MTADRRAFVVEHTAVARAPLVPEITLRLATEVTMLWRATQEWLDARDLPPPFWAFAWAGGQALARYVLDRPETVAGKRVADLASGSGIVAIAAAKAGASSVVAIDTDPFAREAALVNAEANGVAVDARCADALATDPRDFDVILAGDVFYERAMAERFVKYLKESGAIALTGDPERTYAPSDAWRVVASYEVPTPLDLEGRDVKRAHVLRYGSEPCEKS